MVQLSILGLFLTKYHGPAMKELLLSFQKSIEMDRNGQPTLYSSHIYCTFKDHARIMYKSKVYFDISIVRSSLGITL